jgi:hypothetical protein
LRQKATGERRKQHEREIGDEFHQSAQRRQLAMTASRSPSRGVLRRSSSRTSIPPFDTDKAVL